MKPNMRLVQHIWEGIGLPQSNEARASFTITKVPPQIQWFPTTQLVLRTLD